jgi:hypothetical protein
LELVAEDLRIVDFVNQPHRLHPTIEQGVDVHGLLHSGFEFAVCCLCQLEDVAIEGTLYPLCQSLGIHELVLKMQRFGRVLKI